MPYINLQITEIEREDWGHAGALVADKPSNPGKA